MAKFEFQFESQGQTYCDVQHNEPRPDGQNLIGKRKKYHNPYEVNAYQEEIAFYDADDYKRGVFELVHELCSGLLIFPVFDRVINPYLLLQR